MIRTHILRFHLYYLLAALISLRFIFLSNYSIPFWNVQSDYPVLSLSHSIYLDQRFSTNLPSAVGYAQTAHPGIIFQFFSFISYRLASISIPGGFEDRLAHVFLDVSTFWLFIQILPLIIFSLVLYFSRKILSLSIDATFILIAIYFSFQPVWKYGFMYLGNDSFALPIAAILFASFWQILSKADLKFNQWIVVIGLAGSLAFLNKFNYAAWPAGILISIFISSLFCEKHKKKDLIKNLKFIFLSFFIFTCLIVTLYLGLEGLQQIKKNVWSLFSHSGMYGTGPKDFIQAEIFYRNLLSAVKSYPYFWTLFVVIIFQAYLILHSNKEGSKLEDITFLNGIFIAMVLGIFAAFKAYNSHYLIPIVLCMVCMAVWSLKKAKKNTHKYFIFPFILMALANSFLSNFEFIKQSNIDWLEESKEILSIKELPLNQGRRFWSYGIKNKEYNQYFLQKLVKSPALDDLINKNSLEDKHYNIFNLNYSNDLISKQDWKYVVFSKRYFNDIYKTSDYFINNGKVCYSSENFLVIKNKKE